MKSPSIDNLYTHLDKHILLAQSYTEINQLFFIIKSCRLKPYSYLFEDRAEKLVLHRWWIDEFGNSFKITTNKRINIVYNDLALDKNKILCTDLYYGLSINRIAKMSKLAYVCLGKDEDLYQDYAMISFLGIDGYLRTFMYLYNEWQQVSPLLLEMKNLKLIGINRDIQYFRKFEIKENLPAPCFTAEQWITFMPPSKSFTMLMEKEHEAFSPIFTRTQKNDKIHGQQG